MALCPLCNEACAICEGYYCAADTATCKQCGQRYCRGCVEGGFCTTCADLKATAPLTPNEGLDLSQAPLMDDPRVAKVAPHYTWSSAQNHRYTIYLGRAEQRRDALIVTKVGDEGVEVIKVTGQSMVRARQQEGEQPKLKDSNDWLHEFQDWLRRMRRTGRGR